jgi:hypothetical protein
VGVTASFSNSELVRGFVVPPWTHSASAGGIVVVVSVMVSRPEGPPSTMVPGTGTGSGGSAADATPAEASDAVAASAAEIVNNFFI